MGMALSCTKEARGDGVSCQMQYHTLCLNDGMLKSSASNLFAHDKAKNLYLPYVICHNLHTAAIDSAWAREVRTHHHPPYFITTCTCTFGSAPKYRIAAATHASCMTRADTTLFFPSASGVLQSTISSRCCTLHVSTVTVRHLWHPC